MQQLRLILAAVFLLSCNNPTELMDLSKIEFKPQRSWYYSDDTVRAKVTNLTGITVSYNFCLHTLEHFDSTDKSWNAVIDHTVLHLGCNAASYQLRNGGSVSVDVELASTITPGTYRISLPAPSEVNPKLPRESGTIKSRAFEIRHRAILTE